MKACAMIDEEDALEDTGMSCAFGGRCTRPEGLAGSTTVDFFLAGFLLRTLESGSDGLTVSS